MKTFRGNRVKEEKSGNQFWQNLVRILKPERPEEAFPEDFRLFSKIYSHDEPPTSGNNGRRPSLERGLSCQRVTLRASWDIS